MKTSALYTLRDVSPLADAGEAGHFYEFTLRRTTTSKDAPPFLELRVPAESDLATALREHPRQPIEVTINLPSIQPVW